MRVVRWSVVVALAAIAAVSSGIVADAQAPRRSAPPLYQQFLAPATPLEIVAAKKVDRVAWMAYEEGKRNVYTAVAPAFTPVRLTSFLKDDGVDLTTVRISDDGSIVTFIRGTQPNRDGWIANASANPDGADRTLWAVRSTGGPAWKLAEIVGAPELAPNGGSVLFVKDGQIYRTTTSQVRPANARDRGEKAFITAWGQQGGPKWSPDGRKIAFVSTRTDHSFVVVYDMATRTVRYMDPSVDFDGAPMWTADSRHVVFTRRPGLAFGQQGQSGVGSLGNPNGPAFNPNAQTGRGGRGQGGGEGLGRGQGSNPNVPPAAAKVPGLTRATFRGGYALSIMKADVATGEAKEVWHNEPNDRLVANLTNARLAGDYLVFPFNVGFGGGRGGRGVAPQETPSGPVDEWERYYSLNIAQPGSRPVLLTTTDGMIEGQTDVALSPDGRTFYYCTNATDIERRHIWAVPVSGGTPQQLTTGAGIETYPTPLASGRLLATMSAGWKLPQSVGFWTLQTPATAPASQKVVFPSLKGWAPADLHVEPQLVITKAADGLEIHNQLFVPKDIKPGERRPAIVFVHGGPVRQMLLGYHYMHFYHWAYGINEWLASKGYIVMSINFRSGVGYGRSFRTAPNTGGGGNAEYQDVVAGGKYLQSRPDVDPERVGIWGLSYGGVLTGQALARNSDIFKAGVDLAGVHLWGSSLDPEATSYKSSVIGAIDGWKSPVLLVHGDDDRNVAFQQTTGLVQLLRARDVEFELIVFPDDTHESMLHSRWIYTLDRMEKFLRKHLGAAGSRITTERR
jgi:dipeptidyl aminopeptidase/acylaminoacyl peptidase